MSTMQSTPIYVVYVRSAIYGYIVKYRPFLDVDEAHEWLSIQSMHYSVPKGEGNVWEGDTYTVGIETWSVAS